MAEHDKASSLSDPLREHRVLPDPAGAVRSGKTAPVQPDCMARESGVNGAGVAQPAVPASEDRDISAQFDNHVAALALCADGEIRYANRSFAFALGYDSAEELLDAGGLQRLFPTAPPFLFEPEAGDDGRVEEVEAMTRSRRRIRIPAALHCIEDADGQTGWMVILRPEDTRYRIDELPVPSLDTSTNPEDDVPEPPGNETVASPSRRGEELAAEALPEEREKHDAPTNADAQPTVDEAVSQAAEPEKEPVTAPEPPVATVPVRSEHREADFLARVSHDVRIPLNTIIGFAQLMKEERFGPVGNDRYRSYVSDIISSGEHALGVINDLLDISSIEAGAFKLNFTSVDLHDLVADCTRRMHGHAQSERVLIRCSLPQDLPQVLADGHSMNQVLLTLLTNAINVTRPGGQVIVDLRHKRSGAVRLRIQDAGPGMSKQEIAQAMEPFEPHETAPRQQVGTGLGLPLTRALVQANRAGFKLRSSAKSGTRITLTFPADRTVQP